MNEEQANKEATRRIEARSKIFCPIINSMCVVPSLVKVGGVCECFTMPEVYNYDVPKHDKECYDVNFGYCTAYCLKGSD